jgi:tetratricopeptide (TPR) repeat protein
VNFLKVYGDWHPLLALSYFNLGNTHYKMGNYDQAILNFEKSAEIRLRVLGELNIKTGVTFKTLANSYLKIHDIESARLNYSKAYPIILHAYGENHSQTKWIREKLEQLNDR